MFVYVLPMDIYAYIQSHSISFFCCTIHTINKCAIQGNPGQSSLFSLMAASAQNTSGRAGNTCAVAVLASWPAGIN